MAFDPDLSRLLKDERAHQWHPFTQMRAWNAPGNPPLIIERGEGAMLYDREGREYLDGNSSIWTNVHGHNHPHINAAITEQLGKISHSSFLGATHRPAIDLATALSALTEDHLPRVFFSDDGSTAIECAVKMTLQYWQLKGQPERRVFVAFDGAYHGDTLGATSLGGIPTFHGRFAQLGIEVHHVADVRALQDLPRDFCARIAGVAIEPLVQGAAGMRVWENGMLRALRKWCEWAEPLLIYDEVMTGFGRTGSMFAYQREDTPPDILCLAKGLTGGYMPMAATMATEEIYSTFLGGYDETFFYGHSYTANPLGCAAAIANLQVFEQENTLTNLKPKIAHFSRRLLGLLDSNPSVTDLRRVGMIAGIELAQVDGTPFPEKDRKGAAVCMAAREHGLLTRPVGDTLVLMPPLCVSEGQIDFAINALDCAIRQVTRV